MKSNIKMYYIYQPDAQRYQNYYEYMGWIEKLENLWLFYDQCI